MGCRMDRELLPNTTETSRESRELLVRRLVRNARETGSSDGIDGKRKAQRFRSSTSLEFSFDPNANGRVSWAKMHNVSRGGLSFWAKKRLALKRRVFVRSFVDGTPTDWLPAKVCHCTSGIMGFLVGVEFQFEAAE